MEKQNTTQLVINTLLTGKSLTSAMISKILSESTQKEITVQRVSSILSKISDKNKCSLGHLINKEKQKGRFYYNLKNEALGLSIQKAYDLTLKRGKDRYKLTNALEEYPQLKKTVSKADILISKKDPGISLNSVNNKVQINVGYLNKYSFSLTVSTFTFFIICFLLVGTMAAGLIILYHFISQMLIILTLSFIFFICFLLMKRKNII